MRSRSKALLSIMGLAFAASAAAQVTFYEGESFRGRSFTVDGPISSLDPTGFNDRASSAVVANGRWEACEDAYFQGHCVILRPGEYRSFGSLGMNHRISSVRPVHAGARAYDAPPVAYDYGRRAGERIYEVPVASVHAVYGAPEERCWVERREVEERGGANIPGAIVGGVIGGILGHQVGGGRGKDVATAGGAVAGAAIGANVGRGGEVRERDVRRCETVPSANPAYWDVTYYFRGMEHHVQMSSPPGPRLAVNESGEPRV